MVPTRVGRVVCVGMVLGLGLGRVAAFDAGATEAPSGRVLDDATVERIMRLQEAEDQVSVRMVLLPASAEGARGRIIRGLKAADFRLFQDRVPQKIQSFWIEGNEPVFALAHHRRCARQGLFAIVELVKVGAGLAPAQGADARPAPTEPLSQWPQTAPALKKLVSEGRQRGISFAVRGNLIVVSPPLVTQADLAHGLDVMEELLSSVSS